MADVVMALADFHRNRLHHWDRLAEHGYLKLLGDALPRASGPSL